MKRILACLYAALFAFSVNAATLLPVQLLNPAGSTAGQAIVSTGPTTAPGFANVPAANVSGLGTAATQNTGTSGANVPFLNGANTWASGQTFSALISPTSTIGIKGTTTNDSAQAGSVGEYISGGTGATSVTSGTAMNATSISLTAGDWDVSGIVQSIPAGTTVASLYAVSINTTSATRPVYQQETLQQLSFPAGVAQQIPSPTVRISVASTTTVYLVFMSTFTTSTMTASGFLTARRRR